MKIWNGKWHFLKRKSIGLIDADTVTKVIIDSLTRFNLPLNRCHGQCYDGAPNMSGKHAGVCTHILKKEPRAIYIHCMGHSLSLAVKDTCRSS